jgi:hypothetical protein
MTLIRTSPILSVKLDRLVNVFMIETPPRAIPSTVPIFPEICDQFHVGIP